MSIIVQKLSCMSNYLSMKLLKLTKKNVDLILCSVLVDVIKTVTQKYRLGYFQCVIQVDNLDRF